MRKNVRVTMRQPGYRTHGTTGLPRPFTDIFEFASHVPIVQNTGSFKGKEDVSDANIAVKYATNQKRICVSYPTGQ